MFKEIIQLYSKDILIRVTILLKEFKDVTVCIWCAAMRELTLFGIFYLNTQF